MPASWRAAADRPRSIRPGAAVRLEGVWHSSASKLLPNVESQGDNLARRSLIAGTQALADHQLSLKNPGHGSEHASAASLPASTSVQEGEASCSRGQAQASATAELQVSKVEILGSSDPQVRLKPFCKWFPPLKRFIHF